MDGRPLDGNSADERAATHGDGVAACVFGQFRRGVAIERSGAVTIAFESPNDREIPLAQTRCSLNDRVEHRLQVVWRAADDVEHFASRGLVFKRFLQLARARLHLLEEPHILDRDYRLVGEGGDQVDLRGGEGLRYNLPDKDYSDDAPLSQKGDAERRAISADLLRLAPCIRRVSQQVRNMNDLTL